MPSNVVFLRPQNWSRPFYRRQGIGVRHLKRMRPKHPCANPSVLSTCCPSSALFLRSWKPARTPRTPKNSKQLESSGKKKTHKDKLFVSGDREVGWGSSTRRGGGRKLRARPRKFVFLGFRREESGMSREFCRDVPDP